jgi:predicted small lipoprotein YifL
MVTRLFILLAMAASLTGCHRKGNIPQKTLTGDSDREQVTDSSYLFDGKTLNWWESLTSVPGTGSCFRRRYYPPAWVTDVPRYLKMSFRFRVELHLMQNGLTATIFQE